MQNEVRKLWIEGPAGRLECALRVASPARATAVVAHPHPLHGGTLNNPVVFHTDRELHRAGFTTLRFNFRGVASSEGTHDDGPGEIADLAAAAAWVRGLGPDLPRFAVGYSFGASCAIRHAQADPTITAVIALGLAVKLDSFPEITKLNRPLAVVQGENDELGTPEEVRKTLDGTSPPATLRIVENTGHRFTNQATEAAALVVEAAATILNA